MSSLLLLATLFARPAWACVPWTSTTVLDVGDGPSAAIPVDFDGDGDRDLVVSSEDDDRLWWAAWGPGGFGPAVQLATDAWQARDVGAGDFDADGAADLVVARYSPASYGFYPGAGGATLAPPVTLPATLGSPSHVRVADLDADGDLDFLGADEDVVSWAANLGGGTFGAQTLIQTVPVTIHAFELVDLEADGDLDVLVASGDDVWSVKNNGGGSFAVEVLVVTLPGGGPSSFDAGDLDGDGFADVVAASADGLGLSYLQSIGGALFAAAVTLTTIDVVDGVALGDLDADGDLDVARCSPSGIWWHENTGGAVFAPQELLATDVFSEIHSTDLDGDGDDDLVGIGPYDRVAWLSSPLGDDADADGLTDAVETCDVGTDPGLHDTDFGGTSDFDEWLAGTDPLDGADDVPAFDGDGDGLSDAREQAEGTNPNVRDTDADGLRDAVEVANGADPLLADGDGDGVDDEDELLAGTDPGRADTDGDGLSDGDESVSDPLDPDTDADGLPDGADGDPLTPAADDDGDGVANVLEVQIGTDPGSADTDADGLDDGAELDTGADPLRADTDGDAVVDGVEIAITGTDPAFDETGCVGWSGTIGPWGADAIALATADLDGDGDEDLIAGRDHVGGGVATYLNLGGGTLGEPQVPAGATNLATAVSAGDVDDDGHPDVLVKDWQISWHRGDGAGGLGEPVGVLTVSYAAMLLHDLDSDGDLDLLGGESGSVSWAESLGGGWFYPEDTWSSDPAVGDEVETLAVGDIDLDGTDDFVGIVDAQAPTLALWQRVTPGAEPSIEAESELATADDPPTRIDLVDVDGDGDPDVVTREPGSGRAGWYETRLDAGVVEFGVFRGPAFAGAATATATADLDGDGLDDLIVAADALTWHRGDGTGFGPGLPITADAGDAVAIATLDLDVDGFRDVVIARADGRLGTYVNPWADDADLDGLPDAVETCISGTDPAVADSDGGGTGDGDELAAATDPNGESDDLPAPDADADGLSDALEATWWGTDPDAADTDADGLSDADELGRGLDPDQPDTDADGLDDGAELAVGADPVRADSDLDGVPDGLDLDPLSGDGDGDGMPDAIDPAPAVADPDADGDGLADPWEALLGTSAVLADSDYDFLRDGEELASGTDPRAADTDGDGVLDFAEILISATDPLVSEACDAWASSTKIADNAVVVGAGDIDGDTWPDLVSGAWSGSGVRYVRTEAGDLKRADTLDASIGYATAVVLVDLDGNGLMDPMVSTDGDTFAWKSLGELNFSGRITITNEDWFALAAVDFDGDADTDVLACSKAGPQLRFVANRAPSDPAAAVALDHGLAGCAALASADVDGDGDPDLAAVAPGSGSVAWWPNVGGQLGAGTTLTASLPDVSAVALGDLDRDGDPDLVAGTNDNAGLYAWENLGGTFGPMRVLVEHTGEAGLRALAVSDLDGDGDGDILAAFSHLFVYGSLRLYEGVGPYVVAEQVLLEPSTDGIAIVDIDADGATDVAYATYDGGDFGWLRNGLRDDADGDFVPDTVEGCVVATDAGLADSDGGGVGDGEELWMLSDPFDPSDDRPPPDADGDGWSDGYERFWAGTDPFSAAQDPGRVDTTPTIPPNPEPPAVPDDPVSAALPEGCGCSQPGAPRGAVVAAVAAALLARRRRTTRG